MSKKTSTAALESFCKGQLTTRRRAPRHPSGGRKSNEVKKQRGKEGAREFGQAQIVVGREDALNGNAVSGAAQKFRVILPVILRIAFCLAMWTLGAMTMTIAESGTASTTSTKQEENNPLLSRRAALTTPPGAFSRLAIQ
jgi:hypothetical protein